MPKVKSASVAGPSSKPARTSKSKSSGGGASAASRTISGFHLLPVSLSRASSSSSKKKSESSASSSDAIHYIYLRAHNAPASSAQSADLPRGRTLFLVNLPVDTTDRHLRHLFEKHGRIESVKIKRRAAAASGAAVEDMMEDSEGEGEKQDAEEDAAAASQPQSRIRARKDAAKKPTIPSLVPLPPLDPRGADAGFLQTGSTAHIVFLEEDGLSRALAFAAEISAPSSSTKLPHWVDPRIQVRQAFEEAKRSGVAEASDDEDAGGGKRKKRLRPTTALEAQAAALSQDPAPALGLALLVQRHDAHRPSLPAVKQYADSVVARYTFFRAHPRLDPERQKAGHVGGIKVASYGPDGEPLDEDGFTIVLPGGKYGRSLGEGGGGAGAAVKVARQSRVDADALQAKAKAKQLEGLEDFYRFQTRERRKEKLANLRRQFEEDKLKVEKLKESGGGKRRFKPY